MEQQELDVYSRATNCGIVRMPGRQFPGCVIQGDTLFTWFQAAESISQLALSAGSEELVDEATGLVERLDAYLSHYESVLSSHGLRLPYVRARSDFESDPH